MFANLNRTLLEIRAFLDNERSAGHPIPDKWSNVLTDMVELDKQLGDAYVTAQAIDREQG